MVVLDVSDLTKPAPDRPPGLGRRVDPHLPAAARPGLVVATDEQVTDGPRAPQRAVRVIDVAGPRRGCWPSARTQMASTIFRSASAPTTCTRTQPGAYRSERLVFASYFSAGVRVYDLADPARPTEVAHWVPEPPAGQPVPQINDLFVDDTGLLWVTDRIGGGLYVLAPEPPLAALMAQARTVVIARTPVSGCKRL